jgi:hypothetical protein
MKKDIITVEIDLNREAAKVLNILYPNGYCNDSAYTKFSKLDNYCECILRFVDEIYVKKILRKVHRGLAERCKTQQDLKYYRYNLMRKINNLYITVS